MAEWLGQTSQGCKMRYHDLDVVGLNPSLVELGVCSTSV